MSMVETFCGTQWLYFCIRFFKLIYLVRLFYTFIRIKLRLIQVQPLFSLLPLVFVVISDEVFYRLNFYLNVSSAYK